MKDRLILIVSIVLVLIVGFILGHLTGIRVGESKIYVEYDKGYSQGKYVGYEDGYKVGYSNGQEYVTSHLDKYVSIPKPVPYSEVVKFLKEDKVSDVDYSDTFNCINFTNEVKKNAELNGIQTAVVSFDLVNEKNKIGHAINAFETTDKGTVYFDPQTDGERFNIKVGGTYTLEGITYKITKVDIIW